LTWLLQECAYEVSGVGCQVSKSIDSLNTRP
jgi:hypothetical protein